MTLHYFTVNSTNLSLAKFFLIKYQYKTLNVIVYVAYTKCTTTDYIVHGPDKILVTSGGAKDLKYQLVGRINMNKILYDNPTKRVAYRINLAFLF